MRAKISAAIFIVLLTAGLYLSPHLPLWHDEQYSLATVSELSYEDILTGHYWRESNNSPFFYLTQKGLFDLAKYDLSSLKVIAHPNNPFPWNYFWDDPFANRYFRLIPMIFMALAPAALFFYFARFHWMWGTLAVLLCASYPLFWYHGLEARPYSHFFTLTVIQFLTALHVYEYQDYRRWRLLGIVNMLLALTFTTSAFQTVCIALFLSFGLRAEMTFKRLAWAFGLPLLISVYYYSMALKLTYVMDKRIEIYLTENFSYLALGLMILAGVRLVKDKAKEMLPVFMLFVSLLAAYILVMVFIQQQAAHKGATNIFYERYLIALVPAGIIAAVVFGRRLFEVSTKPFRISLIVLFSGVLISRFFDLIHKMCSWTTFQWNF